MESVIRYGSAFDSVYGSESVIRFDSAFVI